ncbi:MAG: hypothetical protein ACLUN5_00640 [Oscillospiraceae bacterium]
MTACSRTVCDYIAGMTDSYAVYKYSGAVYSRRRGRCDKNFCRSQEGEHAVSRVVSGRTE